MEIPVPQFDNLKSGGSRKLIAYRQELKLKARAINKLNYNKRKESQTDSNVPVIPNPELRPILPKTKRALWDAAYRASKKKKVGLHHFPWSSWLRGMAAFIRA